MAGAGNFLMADVTPQMLYARLVTVMGTRTDEELAHALGETLRTVQRLKAGDGVEFPRAIKFLSLAGWLSLENENRPNLDRARLSALRVADEIDRLVAALGA